MGGDGDALAGVLEHFPPVQFAMAYGSGIFHQAGYSQQDIAASMVDFVFAVDDAQQWHTDNLKRNRSHYSSLGSLGGTTIASVQSGYGAKLYYNTLVPVGGMTIKYGVIGATDLVDDLTHWRSFYVSGRMQKPVRILASTPAIQAASRTNLRGALAAALLMVPPSCTTLELFMTLSELSYGGDFRMIVGEHPHKVRNIVEPNLGHFSGLYAPHLQELSDVADVTSGSNVAVSVSHASTRRLVAQLPDTMQHAVWSSSGGSLERWERGLELADAAAGRAAAAAAVQAALAGIVGRHARSQSVKGLLTGGARSGRYIASKLQKWTKAVLR